MTEEWGQLLDEHGALYPHKESSVGRLGALLSQGAKEGLPGGKISSSRMATERVEPLSEHCALYPPKESRLIVTDPETGKRELKPLEGGKRPRIDSAVANKYKGKFKKPKVSVASANLPSEILKVSKPEEDGSATMSMSSKAGRTKITMVQDAGDSSVVPQRGANVQTTELSQDVQLVSKSSVYGQDRRGQLSKGNRIEGISARLPTGQKLPVSNHGASPVVGNKLRERVLLPTSSKKRLLVETKQKSQVVGSHPKPLVVGRPLASSQGTGSSLVVKRHAEVGSSHNAIKKVGVDLNAKAQKSKPFTGNDTKSIRKLPKPSVEGSKSNMLQCLDKSRPIVSPSVRVEGSAGFVLNQQAGRSAARDSTGQEISGKGKSRPQRLEVKIQERPTKHRTPVPELAENRDCLSPNRDRTAATSNKVQLESQLFNRTWTSSLAVALGQKKALLLQNLDPSFSSFEIKDMLKEVLQVPCDVRMLPPKNFNYYMSGEALVLFRNQPAAEDALRKLTKNWLIWSKDERPVLASRANERILKTTPIHGFISASKFLQKSPNDIDKMNAAATSHCSQPNTVEYELGIEWRQLQDRHTQAWRISAERIAYARALNDPNVNLRDQIISLNDVIQVGCYHDGEWYIFFFF